MQELNLYVRDYASDDRWRFVLTDDTDALIAHHDVALRRHDSEYEGFTNLEGYLEWRAGYRRERSSESGLAAKVGRWIGEQVLGAVGPAIVARSPAVVRVRMAPQAYRLLHRPLELGHVAGRPIVQHGVGLVFELDEEGGLRWKEPVGERLRMLAVFSLPEDHSILALRRERYELTRLIRGIADGKAIELRCVQYGVTRQRLAEVLAEARWDIVHISGHGATGGLVLEHPEEGHDLVRGDELARLLEPTRPHVKLVTLSSCRSAAAVADDSLRLLKLDTPSNGEPGDDEHRDRVASAWLSTLATTLVWQLDCAVLAMRYPVADAFAIDLSREVYSRLLGDGRPLSRALVEALTTVAAPTPGHPARAIPALSEAAPALFGARAVDLSLTAPNGQPAGDATASASLRGVPEEPQHFVGQVELITRASAALSPHSGVTTVVLHGMAGVGKTACALELAYGHAHRFDDVAWFTLPSDGVDLDTVLVDFVQLLEQRLPGLQFPVSVGNLHQAEASWSAVGDWLQAHDVLIVLDNLESLLSERGRWRNQAWGRLLTALVDHRGPSRLVLTTRLAPQELLNALDDRVLARAVHALSLVESVLLARELPTLGPLFEGTDTVDAREGRQLVTRALTVLQGHPKLILLADAEAANVEALQRCLDRAGRTWTSSTARLEAFVDHGTADPAVSADDYLAVLTAWTDAVVAELPGRSRDALSFLCALEDSDRSGGLAETAWPQVLERLGRLGEAVPDLNGSLAPSIHHGLVESVGEGRSRRYLVHPAIAAAVRRMAEEGFQAAVDDVLGRGWREIAMFAIRNETNDRRQHGKMLRSAALNAAPYLLRQQQWFRAGELLEHLMGRDHSVRTMTAVLPYLRQIADGTKGTNLESFGTVLLLTGVVVLDPEQARRQATGLRAEATARDDPDLAVAVGNLLLHLLIQAGAFEDALTLANEDRELVQRAGFGPWMRLSHEVQRLQVLNQLGRSEEVLEAVEDLWARAKRLPEARVSLRSVPRELVFPWSVRERLLMAGRWAASELERWDAALRYGKEILHSTLERDATAIDRARARLGIVTPLERLGRTDEAREMLLRCRQVLEEEQDWEGLALVRGEVMALEGRLGHHEDTLDLAADALRWTYLVGDPDAARKEHYNYALSLERLERDAADALAHYLAAAVLTVRMNAYGLDRVLRGLARIARTQPAPSFEEVCRRVATVAGVDLPGILAMLHSPEATDPDEIVADVIGRARNPRSGEWAMTGRRGEAFEEVLLLIVVAASGNSEARTLVDTMIDAWEAEEAAAAFARSLRRMLDGARGDDLAEALDGLWRDAARRILDLLTGSSGLPLPPPKRLLATGEVPQLLEAVSRTVAMVAGSDRVAAQALHGLLASWSSSADWSRAGAALRQVLVGDWPSLSLEDMDHLDRAAVAVSLARLVSAGPGRLGLPAASALQLGTVFQQLDEPERAAALWRSVATADQSEAAADAASRLAQQLADRGDAQAARPWFEAAMAREGSEPAARAAAHYGWMLARLGDAAAAAAAYRRALSSGHTHWAAISALNLGGMFLQAGRYDDARPLLQRAADSGVPDIAAQAQLNLGTLEAEVGDLEGSRAAYAQADRSGQPGISAEAAVQLAHLARQEGKREEARRWLRWVVTNGQAEPMAQAAVELGSMLAQDGDADEARFMYEQAIDAGVPRWAGAARLQLASLLDDAGDTEAAERAWQALLASDQEEVRALAAYRLGLSLYEQGEDQAAETALLAAVRPNAPPELAQRARLTLGLLLTRRGDQDGAIAALRRADAPDPQVAAKAAAQLWALLVHRGALDEARELLPAVVDAGTVDWSRAEVAQLGVLLYERGDPEGARTVLRHVVDRSTPDVSATAAFNLGLISERLGEDEDAEAAYRLAVEAGNPQVAPIAANNLGDLLVRRGDAAEAKPFYQLALRDGEADVRPSAAFSLGGILAAEGDVQQAKALFQIAISSGQVDEAPKAANNLGVLLGEERDVEGATAAFAMAIEANHPDWSAPAAHNLGMLLARNGDSKGARTAFERAIELHHPEASPIARVFLAELLADQDLEAAESLLQQAARSGQGDALLAMMQLAESRAARGDVQAAMKMYRLVVASGHPHLTPHARNLLRLLGQS